MKLKENGYRALIPLFGSALAAFLFLVGIGRYRTILLTSCYYFIEAIFVYARVKPIYTKPIFGPLVIIMLFIDFKYGQLLPIYPNNNVLVAIFAFVLAELLFNKYLIVFIQKISNYYYFGCCPHCHYANKELTNKCSNCGFVANDLPRNKSERIPLTFKSIRLNSKCNTALTFQVPSKCLSLLNFDNNEECIGSLRIFPERGIYVNGSKILVKYIIITTARIILLDYHFYYSGWTYRQYVDIGSIHSVVITRKFHHNKQVPMLLLNTHDMTYEIFYSPFESAFDKLEAIAGCMKDINTAIEIRSERIAAQ